MTDHKDATQGSPRHFPPRKRKSSPERSQTSPDMRPDSSGSFAPASSPSTPNSVALDMNGAENPESVQQVRAHTQRQPYQPSHTVPQRSPLGRANTVSDDSSASSTRSAEQDAASPLSSSSEHTMAASTPFSHSSEPKVEGEREVSPPHRSRSPQKNKKFPSVQRVSAGERSIDPDPTLSEDRATTTVTTTAGLRKEQLHVVARKKRQRKRRIVTGIVLAMLIAIIVVTAIAAIRFLDLTSYFSPATDYDGNEAGSQEVQIEIPAGATGREIATILFESDVVASEDAFVQAFKRNSAAQSIQEGWYSLRTKMKASQALAALLDDANKVDVGITVLPGKTVEEVKQKFLQIEKFSPEDVEAAFSDLEALGLPAEAKGNLEGWLMPDTYHITPDMTAQQLLKQIVQANLDRLDKLSVPQADRQAVMTKASIVEKEGKTEDFGKIARVIENRLDGKGAETGGKLQMDCTVTYGAGKGNSGPFMTLEDKKNDNPYNTYIHPGLPPTPIATVSDDAIKAVLDPPPGDWVFYVTVDIEKGTTKFATSQEEQDKNIAELKKYCENNPDICGAQK